MLKQASPDLVDMDLEQQDPVQDSDLGIFPGSTQAHSSKAQINDIILRMECMSDGQMKVNASLIATL